MSFLYPYVLIGLALPLLLAGLAVWLHHRSSKAWRRLVSPAHERELVHAAPIWRTVLPAILALLALACTILAAARPINGYSEAGAVATGRNLIIALDVSRSMETKDVSPSRLAQAKEAAVELIHALPTDKIGLIVFSGDADMVVPLTYDHAALRETIEQVDRTWVEYGGTNLTLVLNRAMQDFKRSAPDGTNALVIMSDGEETEDENLEEIAQKARKRKLLVIAVGVGTTTGDTIPDAAGENGMWQDAHGKHVISKLQPQTLRKLAEQTGGDFVLMNSGTNLTDFARHAVNKIDRHEEEESINKVPNDLFAYFGITALVLLVAAILLATDWRRPRRAVAVLAALLAMGLTSNAAAEEDELIDDADDGKMSHAEHYAAGLRYLQEKKEDKAKQAFSRALLTEDPKLQAASLYALANINTQKTFNKLRELYKPKESTDDEGGTMMEPPSVTTEDLQGVADLLKKDMALYRDALAADPELSAAKSNLSKIQGLINTIDKEVKRQNEEREQEEKKMEQQNDQNAEDKKEKDKQEGQKNRKDKQQQQKGKGSKQQKQQQQQGQQDQSNPSQGQQQQQNQQGNKGNQDKNKDQQQNQDPQDQQGDQDPQEQQGDENQQEPKTPQEKVEDLINNLQDELDRVKQQQKEKRTPKQQKEDAQDLIDNLKDELEKLKQNQNGKGEQKDLPDKKEQGDDKNPDGKEKQKDGEGAKKKPGKQDKKKPDNSKEMQEAMKLAQDLQDELERLKDQAEKEQELSDQDRQEMKQAKDLIDNLKQEIHRLKMVQEAQKQEEEKKDGAPAASPEKDQEKAEQRAEGMLRMSLDEETGSPIPNTDSRSRYGNGRSRRPRKDY